MSATLTAGASAVTLPVAPPASRTPAWWWAAALGGGPQQALWTLGGAPPEHHTESCGDGGGRPRQTDGSGVLLHYGRPRDNCRRAGQ